MVLSKIQIERTLEARLNGLDKRLSERTLTAYGYNLLVIDLRKWEEGEYRKLAVAKRRRNHVKG